MEKNAYFAGGCFWCITPTFRQLEGVKNVVSGYSGGDWKDPTYQQVKTQKTGHRETILVTYENTEVSFETLLDIFLNSVDPLDDGGQFIDRGYSYTLAVYYTEEAEYALCKSRIEDLSRLLGQPVYISIEPFACFYPAEEYHQNYDLKNPEAFQEELIQSGRMKKD